MENKQVNIIQSNNSIEFESEINNFLSIYRQNILDIKLSSTSLYDYVAMIIYNEVE